MIRISRISGVKRIFWALLVLALGCMYMVFPGSSQANQSAKLLLKSQDVFTERIIRERCLSPFEQNTKIASLQRRIHRQSINEPVLIRLMVIFGVFLISALAGAFYQKKYMQVLSQDPTNMDLQVQAKAISNVEKIVRFLDRKLCLSLSPFSIFLFIIFYASFVTPVTSKINLPIYGLVLLLCIFCGWYSGKSLKILFSFFYCVNILVPAFLIFLIGGFTALPNIVLGALVILMALFIIAVGALWWYFSGFGHREELLSWSFVWLGLAYVDQERWPELNNIIQRLDGRHDVDPVELKWFKANFAVYDGRETEAINILANLTPSIRGDQLLLEIYAKIDEYSRIEERIAAHGMENAAAMLKKLPQTKERDAILIKLWAKNRAWEHIRELNKSMDNDVAVVLLETLPQTSERDDHLLPLLYKTGEFNKVIEVVKPYGINGGLAKLRALLPKGRNLNQLVVLFLYQHGEYNRIRKMLSAFPADESVQLLMALPDSTVRDFMLVECWVNGGNVKAIQDYFADRPPETAIKIITKTKDGIVRDQALARFYGKIGRHDQVVACLESYYEQELLTVSDIKVLACSWGELGKNKKALLALEKAWDLDRNDEEALNELCRKCISFETPSDLLAKLNEETLNNLKASGLWTLVEYYVFFEDMDMARKTAETSVLQWEDQQAAIFMGQVLEDEGNFPEAANFYAAGGEAGYLPQALCLFQTKDYSSAITILQKIEVDESNKKTASYHLGYALYCTGELQKAVEAFQKADPLKEDPDIQKDITMLYGKLGMGSMSLNNFQEAVVYFEKGLMHAPSHAEKEISKLKQALAVSYYHLAMDKVVELQINDSETARFLKKAQEYHSDRWMELDFLSGLNMLKNQKHEMAMQKFSVLSKRYPENRQVRFHNGLSADMAQHNNYAKQVLKAIVADENSDLYGRRAQLLLGCIELREENWDEAEKHLRAVTNSA